VLDIPYRGRFAPSPTGPLHFGSLVAATGSYLDARSQGGEWLLRIEDIDGPRSVPGTADNILRTLEGFGFAWDGPVVVQQDRLDRYHAALVRLQLDGFVFPCACSRREVEQATRRVSVDGGALYPGTCRGGLQAGQAARSWRLRVPDREVTCEDRVQGRQSQNLQNEVGDFVLFRADGQFAYQLAVVVDDALQGVNAVVRGADLLDSARRQIWLQECLGVPTPVYAHLPVATNPEGAKLSKQTRAAAVDVQDGVSLLCRVLAFLGQRIEPEARKASLDDFWRWAIETWALERVPKTRTLPETTVPPSA
jgi:glutamyl-Q tRNA(Asp) synthetase